MKTNPMVTENTFNGEQSSDLYSRLLRDRIVFLGSPITDEVANSITAQFLFLEMDNPDKDIQLYINSPGGSVAAGLAIYDIMQFVKCDVATYCMGTAASMASLLLAAGTQGKRFVMPNSQIILHQPHLGGGGIGGQVTDIQIHARELVRTKDKIINIYARHTGQEPEHLAQMMERDCYLNSADANAMRLVDKVIECRKAQRGLAKAG